MFSILTINAALQDVRLFSRSFYKPLAHVDKRMEELAIQIRKNNADLVCLQELFHSDYQRRFYSLLRPLYPYITGIASPGFKLRLGNELIILSKYPVTDEKLHRFKHATLEERLFTSKGIYSVQINTPDTGKIQIVNFHMTAGGTRQHPEHHSMESIRSNQIRQLLGILKTDMPVILAGDLNAGPEVSTYNYEQILNAGFIDAFVESGGTGVTWDPHNPLVANHRENHLPPQRIDHVFLNGAALKLFKPDKGRIVFNNPCIYISDTYTIPVSDHYGIHIDFRINKP